MPKDPRREADPRPETRGITADAKELLLLAILFSVSSCLRHGGDWCDDPAADTVADERQVEARSETSEVRDGPDATNLGVICPPGSTDEDGICRFPCPEGWDRDETTGQCSPPCPDGWLDDDDGCRPPCPEGMEAVGSLCRPPEEMVGPAACMRGTYDPSGSEGSDRVLHVHPEEGSALGDGSEAAPFATVEQALDALAPEDQVVSVLLSGGSHTLEEKTLESSPSDPCVLRLLGACADTTSLSLDIVERIDRPGCSFELQRAAISGGYFEVQAVGELTLRDCRFHGGALQTIAVRWNAAKSPGGFLIERCEFNGQDTGIDIFDGLEEGEVKNCRFRAAKFVGVRASSFNSLAVRDSWFVGPGQIGLWIDGVNGDQHTLLIERNWIETYDTGISVDTLSDQIEISHISIADSRSESVGVFQSAGVVLSGLRIRGGAEALGAPVHHGVYIYESSGTTLEDCVVQGFLGNGVRLWESNETSVRRSYIAGCGEAGVYSNSASSGISLEDCVLVSNRIGASILGGTVDGITGSMVGGSEAQGIRLRQVENASVKDCVIAGNGSTGLELSVLEGSPETVFQIEDNTIHENTGLGVVVRSGGDAKVRLRSNTVVGTRPGVITNVEGASTVGDGIAVCTGTDGVPSNGELKDNRVQGNYRVGVIIHGQGTTVHAEGTEFLPGNGYGGIVTFEPGGPPRSDGVDYVVQEEAVVSGTDDAVQLADGLPVSNDVSLNGGGDPR